MQSQEFDLLSTSCNYFVLLVVGDCCICSAEFCHLFSSDFPASTRMGVVMAFYLYTLLVQGLNRLRINIRVTCPLIDMYSLQNLWAKYQHITSHVIMSLPAI